MIQVNLFVLAFFLFLTVPGTAKIYAQSSYNQYLSSYDSYREAFSQFRIAKNEYDKFQTLTSRQDAVLKATNFLVARDRLLISYLNYLSEKLNQSPSMTQTERQTYLTLIGNELTFLNSHVTLSEAVSSVNDALDVSDQLESHYAVLQVTVRQSIIAMTLSELEKYAEEIESLSNQINSFSVSNRNQFLSNTAALADRWQLSVSNKLRLFRQKTAQIKQKAIALEADSPKELEANTALITRSLGEAKADLTEAVSYLSELLDVLKYKRS
jgi:hypothetical protein